MQDLYRGFKKISEDDKKAVLKHDSGHVLHIAKAGLNKKHLKNLTRLPLHQANPTGIIPERETDSEKPEAKQVGQEIGSELMSNVLEGMKESLGTVSKQPEPNATDVETGLPVVRGIPVPPQGLGSADVTQYGMAGNLPLEPGDKSFQAAVASQLPQAKQTPPPEELDISAPQIQKEVPQEVAAETKMPAAPLAPAIPTERAIAEKPLDTRPIPEILADPKVSSSDKMQAANQWAINTFNKMQAADQKFDEEIRNNPIIVPKLFSNMNFLQRLGTTIGLMIGGASAAITRGPNPLLQSLNDDIAREVDAQKRQREEKFSLYKMHSDRLRDEYQAALQTENNIRLIAQQRFDEAAGKTGLGPAAREAIELARQNNRLQMQQNMMNLLQSKYRQQVFKSTMGQQAQGAAGGDPSTLVPLLVPEAHQKEVYKSIDAAINTRKMADSIMKSFEQAVEENTVLKTGAGFLRTPGSVMALHQHMQPTFADLEGTVRQSAMDNTFANITPMPGDTEHKIEQKREALIEYLQSKASASAAKAYGIDLKKFEKTAPYQEWPFEGKIAVNKKTGKKIIGRGGKWVPYAD